MPSRSVSARTLIYTPWRSHSNSRCLTERLTWAIRILWMFHFRLVERQLRRSPTKSYRFKPGNARHAQSRLYRRLSSVFVAGGPRPEPPRLPADTSIVATIDASGKCLYLYAIRYELGIPQLCLAQGWPSLRAVLNPGQSRDIRRVSRTGQTTTSDAQSLFCTHQRTLGDAIRHARW